MPQPTSSSAIQQPYDKRWPMLFTLLLAGFMNLMDVSIVNVALPSLQENLQASSSEIEWVVAAYILAFAIGLLPFGRLGDRIGRKRMFLAGVGLFTLFSGLCGLAPSTLWLILFRACQGFAGAMMMPQVLAIAQVTFPPQERGAAFALFGLSAGLATVSGPVIGGLLISADIMGLDWRPIFLVNLPIGIFALVAARMIVPPMPGESAIKNDLPGTLIAGLSIFLIVFALIEGRGFDWAPWIFVTGALGLAGLLLFFYLETQRDAAGRSLLLPISLFSNRNFALGTSMTLLFSSGIAGFFMVLAVFLQNGFQLTPLQSGLTTLPFSLGVLGVSFINRYLGNRWQRARVAAGALMLVVGMAWLYGVVDGIAGFGDHWALAPALLIAGVGLGTTISSLFATVLATVPARDAGSGSGALQSFQQVGGALGVAVMGQIFFSTLAGGAAQGSALFVDAMRNALIYEVIAFGCVALLVLLLKAPPASQGQHQHREQMMPAEA